MSLEKESPCSVHIILVPISLILVSLYTPIMCDCVCIYGWFKAYTISVFTTLSIVACIWLTPILSPIFV